MTSCLRYQVRRVSSSFCLLLIVSGQTNIAATAYRDVQRWTGAVGIGQRICKADVFDETFGVNSAFKAELFVAPPHAVAMEFDLFGERRSRHWVKGGGDKRERLVEWSAFENRTNCRPDPKLRVHASCRLPCTFHLLPSADLFRELAAAFHRY